MFTNGKVNDWQPRPVGRPSVIDGHADQVFAYICEYKRAHDGLSPTVREIQMACDVSSTSVVQYTLRLLVKRGKLRFLDGQAGQSRRYVVVGGRWEYEQTR